MTWLLSLYIGATVFGVGVTVIDLLGLLGGESEGGDSDSDADGDLADGDLADGFESADDAGDSGDDAAGEDTDDGGEDHSSIAGHDVRRKRSVVLRIMAGVRALVYFALGFGPVGWFALGSGQTALASIAYAAPVGALVMLGARGLRRLLRSELSSSVKESDLLMERGEVTVTIGPGQLGRVRIKLGGAYIDRYARAQNATSPLAPGTAVRVVDVSDECVYVEQEQLE